MSLDTVIEGKRLGLDSKSNGNENMKHARSLRKEQSERLNDEHWRTLIEGMARSFKDKEEEIHTEQENQSCSRGRKESGRYLNVVS